MKQQERNHHNEDRQPEPGQKQDGETVTAKDGKPPKRHFIKPRWLRITLRTLLGLLIFILLSPVLLYLPPVQDLAVNIARNVVKKSTGMEIGIGKFRLTFPLDVRLSDVYVLTATGDTMMRAGEAVADVKLLPLLKLDVDLNKLELERGYYRMVSTDSSMIMAVNAGLLTVDDKSSVDIRKMRILLNKVRLKDGDVALYMNVWKKKPTPEDTTSSTPMFIQANDLELENFGFGMSMLPTIDTLDMRMARVVLKHGIVDLSKNEVSWRKAGISNGTVKYLTPTAEWVKAHPAPTSEPSTGPPMVIKGDTISAEGLSAMYATKGVKPAEGFDPSYISVSDVALGLVNFYNESSTVKLPITLLRAKERSGLQITSGRGVIGIDSIGLSLNEVKLNTLFSKIEADAIVPFAVMAMDENTPMRVKSSGHLGLPDIEAFLPMAKTYTTKVPLRKPLSFDIDADGTLAKLAIHGLKAEMQGILSLTAKGYADNALDYKKLRAKVDIDGALMDPLLAQLFLAESEMKIPAFHIKGTADANGLEYGADLTMTTTAGDLAAKGRVALTPERYTVVADAIRLNVGKVMPSLGIGEVTAHIDADGAGFNPMSGNAVTDAKIRVDNIEYKGSSYRDIRADAVLHGDGALNLLLSSANPGLNLELDGSGTIHKDDYYIDMVAHVNDLDLQKLGFSDSLCNGKGTIYLTGTASPERWLYDADLKLVDFDWNLPNRFFHLPGGIHANIKATEFATLLDIDSHLTNIRFSSPMGLKGLMAGFTTAADTVMAQVKRKNIGVDGIREALPQFTLDMNASGKGLLGQFLTMEGMNVDTVWGHIERDSLISGNIHAREFSTSGINTDTLWLTLSERGRLMDYKIHMGNRPGTLDEFADVTLQGYLGNNRLGAFLTQRNAKKELGYRLGLTASLMDSTVTVHFTPFKATIAYMPWSLNKDNYLDYNLYTMRVNANLEASSRESSILARTEPGLNGDERLRLVVDNLHIEDFLRMSVTAPPVKGSVSTNMTVDYKDEVLHGGGFLNIRNLQYERKKVGDFNLDVEASYGIRTGALNGEATLRVNERPALTAYAMMGSGGKGITTDSIGVRLTRFPLNIANAFLANSVQLQGYASGDMRMNGDFSSPRLNGALSLNSARVKIPMFGANLIMDTVPITVESNVLRFDDYDIWAANRNPLTINGIIDASKFSNILVGVSAHAANMQLINSDKRSKADLYGKIFMNLDATARGPMSRLDINANLNLLGTTDATYRLNMSPSELQATSDQNVVRFVNFNDTALVNKLDTVERSAMNMRVNANVTISPGTAVQVLLSTNGTDKVQIQPTANLAYRQSFTGDMSLTGTLTLGNGFARYAIPIIGERMFDFAPTSTLTWTGNIANPMLNVTATDKIKANVTDNGNSRLVNFLVTLKATNTVERLAVAFDLSTNDDLAIENELQSMSADQRQTQAMNLVLYNTYQGAGGIKGNANLGGNMLYSFLESQLNSWAAKNIRGVDLSFGVNQYEKATNGVKSTETSYSYQVSKTLFNNRFKIQVGGNYSTDQNAEENLAQNLVSDISLEYIIKQTATQNQSIELFRRQNYESILEGEITETGVAYVFRRKLGNLLRLFRRRKKRTQTTDNILQDTVVVPEGSDGDPKVNKRK